MSKSSTLKLAVLLAPLAATAAGAGTPSKETVVYTFGASNGTMAPASGRFPYAGLLGTQHGQVFYGTTTDGGLLAGGTNGGGTLYSIRRGGSGALVSILHTFNSATEGSYAANVPVTDGTSFYGALTLSGPNGEGAIYQWTPSAQPGGTLTVLHVFTGGADGAEPEGLYRSADGTLYGTTSGGQGDGTVFSLTPPAAGQTGWTYRIIYAFTGGADGLGPQAAPVGDASGNLYGTTAFGGTAGNGSVFKLQPPTSGQGAWTETTISTFAGSSAPSQVEAPLILDAAGNLYGASDTGGAREDGTVFELTPPAAGGTDWSTQVLFTFTGLNGREPAAPLLMSKGVLYGTTTIGGAYNAGEAFALSPPAAGQTAWQESILLSFQRGRPSFGGHPYGGFALAANGELISTTSVDGTTNSGVIYLLTP